MSKNEIRLLKIEQVMEILQLSRTTIYHMLDSGEIPFLKIGERSVRIKESDLNDYIESQKAKAAEKRGQTFRKEVKKRNLKVIV